MTTLERIARAIYAVDTDFPANAEVRPFEEMPRYAHCWRIAQVAIDAMPKPVARGWAVQLENGAVVVSLVPNATEQAAWDKAYPPWATPEEIEWQRQRGARAFRCLLVEDDGSASSQDAPQPLRTPPTPRGGGDRDEAKGDAP